MEKEKKPRFNYQVVYKINDHDRIIFTGSTNEDIDGLLAECNTRIALPFGVPPIENLVYQPVNTIQNESQKES